MQGRNTGDIELTQSNGKRFLVNAFSISAVLEGLKNSEVIFGDQKIKVRESYDDIVAAKQKAQSPPSPKKAPPARTPIGYKNSAGPA